MLAREKKYILTSLLWPVVPPLTSLWCLFTPSFLTRTSLSTRESYLQPFVSFGSTSRLRVCRTMLSSPVWCPASPPFLQLRVECRVSLPVFELSTWYPCLLPVIWAPTSWPNTSLLITLFLYPGLFIRHVLSVHPWFWPLSTGIRYEFVCLLRGWRKYI